jgi:hypothetical protein
MTVDEEKVRSEARFDGKWVLSTNTDLDAAEVALKYKQLWRVEEIFRTTKSVLATRPIHHKTDAGIRGHVFCSFLALLLRKQLKSRLESQGCGDVEWLSIVRDLDRLEEVYIEHGGKTFRLRTEARGVTGKVCRAVGVALPPTIQEVA